MRYPGFFAGCNLVLFVGSFLRKMIEIGSGIEGFCAFQDTRLECALDTFWGPTAKIILFVSMSLFATFVLAVRDYGVSRGYINSRNDN